jgi:hypothetical protein
MHSVEGASNVGCAPQNATIFLLLATNSCFTILSTEPAPVLCSLACSRVGRLMVEAETADDAAISRYSDESS